MSDWHYSHLTAKDNPAISAEAFAQLVAEYPAGSPQLAQEVYAHLIQGGAGLAFPEWEPAAHVVQSAPDPDLGEWFAGMDWGYTSLGCVVLLQALPDKAMLVRWAYPFKEQTPYQVGQTLGQALLKPAHRMPQWIAGDAAMWAVTDGGESVAEGVQRGLSAVLDKRAPGLFPAPKGPGSRTARKMVLHQALAFKPEHLRADADGVKRIAPFHAPRLRFHRDADYLIRTIPRLPLDEKNPEDVDTRADDHGYDALTYALVARPPAVTVTERAYEGPDRAGTFDAATKRFRRPGTWGDEQPRGGPGFTSGMTGSGPMVAWEDE